MKEKVERIFRKRWTIENFYFGKEPNLDNDNTGKTDTKYNTVNISLSFHRLVSLNKPLVLLVFAVVIAYTRLTFPLFQCPSVWREEGKEEWEKRTSTKLRIFKVLSLFTLQFYLDNVVIVQCCFYCVLYSTKQFHHHDLFSEVLLVLCQISKSMHIEESFYGNSIAAKSDLVLVQ